MAPPPSPGRSRTSAPYLAGGRADPPPPPVLVWASMADKDVPVDPRRDRGQPGGRRRDRGVHGARRPAGDARRRARRRLAGGASRAATVREVPDPDRALDLALATGDGPVVVAGSLYLVGAARARLVDDPLLRDPVAA